MIRVKNKKIFVGVSGGVDSAVSLYLLKKAGYDVTGVFIRTWTPDFIECTWRDERRDAMRICAELDVKFLECNAEEEYKKGVADYMIEEYRKGRTPNPDVMCNREVKFGVFWEFAKSHGADAIATGHYARVSDGKLLKGLDHSKDQSYFLWTLTKEDLSHVLFPVGELNKKEVRKVAKKIELSNATKKDSQGVCFLGPIDLKQFLSHYIKTEKGNVLNEQGETIGHHDGAIFFTLGERHGFTITKKTSEDKPFYVVSKDIENNTLTVSNEPKKPDTKSAVNLTRCVFREDIEKNKNYKAQFRYHGEELSVNIETLKDDCARVTFTEGTPLVSKGQSIVLYDGDVCIGGGVIN